MAPNVARLPGAPDTPEARILAPLLSLGRGSMASHRSAAYLWGVEIVGDTPVDVTVLDRGRRLTLANTTLHRPRHLTDARPIRRSGIPATNPLRILVDLGAVAPEAVGSALEVFIVRGYITRRSAEAVLQRHSRPGERGLRALRQALALWPFDQEAPDSSLERAMLDLCARFGVRRPEFHPSIHGFEVDFAWVPEMVIVECDGWETHGANRQGFARDRERDPVLTEAGWVVLRFTWHQVIHRPAWVAARIKGTLLARAGFGRAR
jgi:very-short-patch-repair endonuclease